MVVCPPGNGWIRLPLIGTQRVVCGRVTSRGNVEVAIARELGAERERIAARQKSTLESAERELAHRLKEPSPCPADEDLRGDPPGWRAAPATLVTPEEEFAKRVSNPPPARSPFGPPLQYPR